MKVVIVPDKFKGSLSASQVCAAIESGIHSVSKDIEVVSIPLADGGDGTAMILTECLRGTTHLVSTHDPLNRPSSAFIGISQSGDEAYVDLASASGLALLSQEERNPLHTSTKGTGELISKALDMGVKRIILGIGGSATNDMGIGLASALGARFFDQAHNMLEPLGRNLIHIHEVNMEKFDPRIFSTEFTVLTDVTNPLTGELGAAHYFARQKGATDQDVEFLERGVAHMQKTLSEHFSVDLDFPGAGAAGGVGAGCRCFLDAKIIPGVDFMLRALRVEEAIQGADLVLSGEGKIDKQSLRGKVVSGVSAMTKEFRKELWLLAGTAENPEIWRERIGFSKLITLREMAISQEHSVSEAAELLSDVVAREFQSWMANKKS